MFVKTSWLNLINHGQGNNQLKQKNQFKKP